MEQQKEYKMRCIARLYKNHWIYTYVCAGTGQYPRIMGEDGQLSFDLAAINLPDELQNDLRNLNVEDHDCLEFVTVTDYSEFFTVEGWNELINKNKTTVTKVADEDYWIGSHMDYSGDWAMCHPEEHKANQTKEELSPPLNNNIFFTCKEPPVSSNPKPLDPESDDVFENW